MLRLTCECGRVLGYEERQIGKKVRCAGCQRVLVIPADPNEEPEVVSQPTSASAPSGRRKAKPVEQDEEEEERGYGLAKDEDDEDEDEPASPVRHRAPSSSSEEEDDEEEEEEEPLRRRSRPRRARRRSGEQQEEEEEGEGVGATLGYYLCSQPGLWAIGLLIGLGLIGQIISWAEGTMRTGARHTPQTLTLHDLLTKGYGDNSHVVVTDFIPADNYLSKVSVRKSEQGTAAAQNKPWDAVYLPLFPITPELKARAAASKENIASLVKTNAFPAILVSFKAKNATELERLLLGGQLQGMVMTDVYKIDSSTQEKLKSTYPGTDWSKVVLIEDRRPMSRGLLLLLSVGGGFALGLGLVLGVLALIFRPR